MGHLERSAYTLQLWTIGPAISPLRKLFCTLEVATHIKHACHRVFFSSENSVVPNGVMEVLEGGGIAPNRSHRELEHTRRNLGVGFPQTKFVHRPCLCFFFFSPALGFAMALQKLLSV